MTANGNSPLDNMRTLEHYLSDIMRAGAADTSEHLKGMSRIYVSPARTIEAIYTTRARNIRGCSRNNGCRECRVSTPLNRKCGESLQVPRSRVVARRSHPVFTAAG